MRIHADPDPDTDPDPKPCKRVVFVNKFCFIVEGIWDYVMLVHLADFFLLNKTVKYFGKSLYLFLAVLKVNLSGSSSYYLLSGMYYSTKSMVSLILGFYRQQCLMLSLSGFKFYRTKLGWGGGGKF
jgi:hypothetical protein